MSKAEAFMNTGKPADLPPPETVLASERALWLSN